MSTTALSASAGISSGPDALLFFSCCIAFLISSLAGLSQLIGRSSSAGWMTGGFGGAGLFRSSSKCSAHLSSCCSFPMIAFPSLSFTGRSGWQYLPDSFLVVS